MGRKGDHAQLTTEEAKAQLLAISGQPRRSSLIGRHPFRSLGVAMLAGLIFTRLPKLGTFSGLMLAWVVKKIIPLPGGGGGRNTGLERIRGRVRRRR